MKILSVTCGVVVLLCLMAFPVIDYLSGRQGTPLIVRPFFPAQVVPFMIGLVALICLLSTVVVSLVVKLHRRWSVGALTVCIMAIGVLAVWDIQQPWFLRGLRDRCVTEIGYAKMREFANEVSQNGALLDSDGVIRQPIPSGDASPREQERWDDLVSRHPFLGWNRQSGTIVVGEGQVELHWGTAFTSFWGFQVSTGAPLEAPEEDRGRVLRVADDIQFVRYYD